MAKMACAQCGGAKMKKMASGGTPSMIVGMPKYGNNPRTQEGRVLKNGGSFAPNRAVQASCKNGMVRDASGKCVMERKQNGGPQGIRGMRVNNLTKRIDRLSEEGYSKIPKTYDEAKATDKKTIAKGFKQLDKAHRLENRKNRIISRPKLITPWKEDDMKKGGSVRKAKRK